MNIKDILSDNQGEQVLIFDRDFYSSIYKKTEKIVCAVYLITDKYKDIARSEELVSETRRVGKDILLSVAKLGTSTSSSFREDSKLPTEQYSALRSLLHVLLSARILRADLVDVLAREIDGVIQMMHTFAYTGNADLSLSVERLPDYIATPQSAAGSATGVRRKAQQSPYQVSGADTSSAGRREAITSIIRARGVVSIKDISDSITDCSEKTIQRELMDMIKDNVIVKEGERRWSKYSMTN